MNLRIFDLHRRGVHQDRIGLQAIERRYFARQRSQGSDLDVPFLRNLLEPRIAVLQFFSLRAELIKAGNLVQHPGIGTGDASKPGDTDRRPGDNDIQVMNGDGNLAQLAVFVARHEKYVKAFAQYGIRYRNLIRILPERNSLLGLRILIPPASSGSSWLPTILRNQASRNSIRLQPIQAAALGSAKGIRE